MPPPSDASPFETTLFANLLRAGRKFGTKTVILEDADRQSLDFGKLKLGSLVLGARLVHGTEPHEVIGVLLPNVSALVVSLFGINAFGRVAALLNFTAGERNLVSAARTAQLRTVITSRRFVETAKLETVVAALSNTPVETLSSETARASAQPRVKIVYLEDIRAKIGVADKLWGVLRSVRPLGAQHRAGITPDTPAVILFTSGTEGAPKGVVLSNKNILANAHQIIAHAAGHLTSRDVVVNPLPMFHSFGLTAGTLMPIFNGMKVSLYPSPLHYREVPKQIRRTKASVVFATDTFLQGYARAAGEGDLASVRIVVAGAERVKSRTRLLWEASGAEIVEGYGATECAPVLAVNLPGDNVPGSVGRLLPEIETRLEPVAGITDGGRLLVRGPNVMVGYMLADAPGKIVPPEGGWHDTGDIVTNENGRITIKGRAKRFAKIGGEMVSLAAVEALVAGLWPDAQHVVVAIADAKKGEQLVLLSDQPDADKARVLKYAQARGFPELWVPKAVLVVANIPVLGSGKVDLKQAQSLVENSRPLL